MSKPSGSAPSDGSGYIIRPYITLRNGRRIFASSYGKKGFTIPIDPDYAEKKKKRDDEAKKLDS